MRVLGIDITSRPSRRKPLTVAHCRFDEAGCLLHLERIERLLDFAAFDALLARPGRWIAGLDAPFGQSRRFIENIGWPDRWSDYVEHVASLSREQYRAALDAYRVPRAPGDKEHARRDDRAAGSVSPQKLYGVPVGLMFYEVSKRLLAAGVTVPGLLCGDPARIAVEAYPGALARHLIGRRAYKNDAPIKQTPDQSAARRELLEAVRSGRVQASHGVRVSADDAIAHDPMADELDALLCAVQAAWAWTRRAHDYGRPADADPLEGWIAEATLPGRG